MSAPRAERPAGPVLVTGAAGMIGGFIRPALERSGRTLRYFDVEPTPVGDPAVAEAVVGSVEDVDALRSAVKGASAVVHLGGIPKEAPFHAVVAVNIVGTYNVLEAARLEGISRVVLASSNHVAGFHPRPRAGAAPMPAAVTPRPDTYYAWSKAAAEVLGRLYHDRFGMDIVAIRIAQAAQEPSPDPRGQAMWFSPDDNAALIEAALTGPGGYHLVWGVSDNATRGLSLTEAEHLGYRSIDDSAAFTPQLRPDVNDRLGGLFCEIPLGEWRR
ncbi:NAD-dependent epimerase/dehydratase family protein [Jiangella endophytica]|uniref:NAD-dependent epimerase/dehydratase family protein n=1 Tax=Jiangella endophytica TaxID=1623398 RepID=UPI001E51607E|nr:NAD(P)-dependent oxidoreductase [Jiangella endophytica]